eukprot:CAMPEP_0114290492 /NCGR_PEP_ID=MMETSP0059-20121206/7963_1 /TAXON_ID=36894 /ORGANISM="Pyramimonas parkeae, Strain CCMP726" /LENGTH=526 /DNA_ID=CAMNT_0001411889 /DNA_START=17 /DNA_END=1598 /DNA_ORIENTATION=+
MHARCVSFKTAARAYQKPEGLISYGTAGFRAKADALPSTVFRCGVLAALRALHTGATVGGHACNGVGGRGQRDGQRSHGGAPLGPRVQVGGEGEDRPRHKLRVGAGAAGAGLAPQQFGLAEAAQKGIQAMGVKVCDLGLVTTPQLHFLVRARNRGEPCSEEAYFLQLARGFATLAKNSNPNKSVQPLILDASNGVGGPKWHELARHLDGQISAQVRNNGDGRLNEKVGADFVQKEKLPPLGVSSPGDDGSRIASVDGDADRLVYFSLLDNQVTLFDGDKIATLMASYVCKLLKTLPPGQIRDASVGVVQTAYANGASTKFITEGLGLKVEVTPTGVKHLHKAAEEFDVGIYFEANGHGTVLFKDGFMQQVNEACAACPASPVEGTPESALVKLRALGEVVNQAVGDALSGILVVEAILSHYQWQLKDWAGLYMDVPSRQLKVQVKDRNVIETMNAETRVKTPAALQSRIDESVGLYESGRSFVRPSGTEDVVRVYAEASTQAAADELARIVARHVHQICGGVGAEP